MLTGKRVIGIGTGITLVVIVSVVLIMGAFATPTAHDVRTPGALQLDVTFFPGDYRAPLGSTVKATQSLEQLRCGMWADRHQGQCDPAAPNAKYFPRAVQAPDTLYVVWLGCPNWFNVEYMPSPRTVVIHCYTARPYIYFPRPMESPMVPAPALEMLALPTTGFGSGTVTIVEDDRIEYWLGDDSHESTLATASIV